MTPSWMTQALAEERQRDLMAHQRAQRAAREARDAARRTRLARRGVASSGVAALNVARRGASWRGGFGLREWLGWRLVDLGVHLVIRPVAARSALVPSRD